MAGAVGVYGDSFRADFQRREGGRKEHIYGHRRVGKFTNKSHRRVGLRSFEAGLRGFGAGLCSSGAKLRKAHGGPFFWASVVPSRLQQANDHPTVLVVNKTTRELFFWTPEVPIRLQQAADHPTVLARNQRTRELFPLDLRSARVDCCKLTMTRRGLP